MGSLLDGGGGALTAIVLAVLGAVLLLGALGAFLMWRRADDPPPGTTGRPSRLGVSEAAIVDGQRRLVLVRRDHVEHLLLIGGPSDIVVESSILRQRPAGAAPRPALVGQGERPAQRAAPAAARPGAAPIDRERSPEPDETAQERLRAASAALALRQVSSQPAQAVQTGGNDEAAEAPAPGSTAVAGLAAGLAALTAAAGARARTDAPESGAKDAEPTPPRSDPMSGQGLPPAPAPDETSRRVPLQEPARSDAAKKDEEPGRAVFGRRVGPEAAALPAGAAEPPAAGAAANDADGQVAEKADARPRSSEEPNSGRDSVAADFAFLDGSGASDVQPAASGPAAAPAPAETGQSEPAEGDGPAPPELAAEHAPDLPPPALQQGSVVETLAQVPAEKGAERQSPTAQVLAGREPDSSAAPEAGEVDGPAGSNHSDWQPAPVDRSATDQDEARPFAAPAPRAAVDNRQPVQPLADVAAETARREAPRITSDDPAGSSERGGAQGSDLTFAAAAGQHVLPRGWNAAPSISGPAGPMSGFRPSRGTTLGDLAERLEEVLIQQAASGTSPERGGAMLARAEPMSPSPAPPERDAPAPAADAERNRAEFQRDEPAAPAAAEKDDAAIIDFAARRKSSGDSLEEEMARLLGELTRDTSRR